jgi:hypothetical protein
VLFNNPLPITVGGSFLFVHKLEHFQRKRYDLMVKQAREQLGQDLHHLPVHTWYEGTNLGR